ncbi:UNVERIFIED_CONTAM: hypothetical protein GTU68_029523 [Idotea baltica]|nr:hypothetical protein [Idotea baltica]
MKKILVANRGEIAMRIIRTLKEMRIASVAVFSEADRKSPHVRLADEAFCIGPAPSAQSYLCGDRIIELALKHNVEGIHPGYGFLSENAIFAEAVTKAGMKFIGPKPNAIRIMGSKLAAKKAVEAFDVPMVPGTDQAITDRQEAKAIAVKIGFPILIKASAGGGGKGMRIVKNESEFEEQLDLARNEAKSAFGDDAVFIEKYISSPRHIEIQVLSDQHGNHVDLFERECSIQRRHQKVVEEAPSAVLTETLRKQMGETATQVARACDYEGAGTVEFLLDQDMNYYFLEMNTRLQVEHPVTEYITGIDLVREQINIANGERISFKREDLKITGHAIELRIYAEDPLNNFLPDIGKLKVYKKPYGAGIRVDDGYEEQMDIPIYYDSMIAKLIVHAENRELAIRKMKFAISQYQIVGIQTTLDFGSWLMSHEDFIKGNIDTHFIGNYFDPSQFDDQLTKDEQLILAKLTQEKIFSNSNVQQAKIMQPKSNWLQNRAVKG